MKTYRLLLLLAHANTKQRFEDLLDRLQINYTVHKESAITSFFFTRFKITYLNDMCITQPE